MRKIASVIITLFALTCLNVGIAQGLPQSDKISFWDKTQKGTNIFNREITREDIRVAKTYGIDFIRLAPDKFPTKQRDFLIGNADNYTQLVPEDLDNLIKILDGCAEEEMPVVLTMISLPGSRWKQHNGDKDDLRIWSDPRFQKQAVKFWKDLATVLRDHPAIVGYNLLNEPHPERLFDVKGLPLYEINQPEVQEKLFGFYRVAISEIRSVDKNTPIILDSSSYADPQAFAKLKRHQDPNIIYSFHMYEPFEYTNHKANQGRYVYPGEIEGKSWNRKSLENYLSAVQYFQKAYKIPSSRVLVGEFGGYRMSKGLPKYFKDLTSIYDKNNWHTAFYAFREDTWDGMDYELGDKKLPWTYWQAIEEGKTPVLERKPDAPAFKVLIEALQE